MKFCARCGSKNTDETAVCAVCGLPFAGAAPMTEPKKTGRAFSVIVILLAVLSIAIAAVIMILSMPKAEAPVMEVPVAIPTAEVTPTPEVTPEPEPEPTQVPATPEPTPTEQVEDYGNGFTPVSRAWSGVKVTVIGAEFIVDEEGRDAIRIFFNLKNTSEETSYLGGRVCNFDVKQDGEYTERTFVPVSEYLQENFNCHANVRPGATIRCAQEYLADPNGGKIYLTINPPGNGTPLYADFDPANMPGRPAFDFVPDPVPDPQWLMDAPDRGTVGEDCEVYIDSAEIIPAEDGGRLVRVYMELTNNSSQITNVTRETEICIFQDGVQLEWAAKLVTQEELNTGADVQPGETVRFAVTRPLYSSNPVEVEIYSEEWVLAAGCVFDIPAA